MVLYWGMLYEGDRGFILRRRGFLVNPFWETPFVVVRPNLKL